MENIKAILSGAIKGDSKNEQLLVKLCIDIAEAYLRTKVKKHSFLINIAVASLRDFAIDSVAELFEKRENRLVVFEKWIPEKDISQFSEGRLFIQLRRLVFSKVNDRIFGTYKEYDPSLSKIMRNIKRVINEGNIEELIITSDGKSIRLGAGEKKKTALPVELLSMKFSSRFSQVSSTVDALEQLRVVFELMEDEYDCEVHITAFALILRQFHTALRDEEVSDFDSVEMKYLNSEVKEMVSHIVEKTKRELYGSYVTKNKIAAGDFSGYFMVVRSILESEFGGTERQEESFYEHFVLIFGEMSKEEYRNSHRKFLEYFVKLSKQRFFNYLKKENDSANKLP